MAPTTSNDILVSSYESNLDRWTIDAYQAGARDFWHLVSLVPGVFPTVVRNVVEKLIATSMIPAHLALEVPTLPPSSGIELEVPGLPTPHPLAFDWRFTRETADKLLERAVALTDPSESIALLGAPTVYFLAELQEAPRRFNLLDQNCSLADHMPQSPLGSTFHCCDLVQDMLDLPPVNVVLADPPWYEGDVLGFLRASAQICADRGTVLLSFGPDGMRPGIPEERERIMAGAEEMGLKYVGIERLALSYATPFFERNALVAAQFKYVPSNWRRGDLLVFKKEGYAQSDKGSSIVEDSAWSQADVRGVGFWIRRNCRRGFTDPRLLPLVPGDILPTVSRRDIRRESAEVWTTGNRIYRCCGSHILSIILHAIEVARDPIEAIQQSLRRSLYDFEITLVELSIAQVGKIVETERQEMWSYTNGQA